MNIYAKIYEFAATAGAFEGYVYRKSMVGIDMETLRGWTDNLVGAYNHLPSDVREKFQELCDETLGRAIHSLIPTMDEQDDIIKKLKSMVKGPMPESADDFKKEKWFENE